MSKGKGKVCRTPTGYRRGAHLPFWDHEPVGGNITIVCDAWPVRRQTYGYLPIRKASPPIGWYQIILLGDRGTCVLTTCPGLHSITERPGFELVTYWSQVQRPNHSATESHTIMSNLPLIVLLIKYNNDDVLCHSVICNCDSSVVQLLFNFDSMPFDSQFDAI